ncbi:MAG TPA: hypothetical protein ENG73_05000 [Desulfobacterales bacterium]|nr:hypothetical protein [Desulfobacterales bacterium]
MMIWSPRTVDRTVSRVIYLGLCAMAVWAGSALINYSLDTKLYKDYLLVWIVCGQRFNEKQVPWPSFDGTNHIAYMSELVRRMRRAGITPPDSNTKVPYAYLLDRLWEKEEKIFVLLLPDRMIIYGMSRPTFEKVDDQVDGTVDLGRGRFKGKVSKDGTTIIGMWGMS